MSGEIFHHVGFVGGVESEYLPNDKFGHEKYAPDKSDSHPYNVEYKDLDVREEAQGGEFLRCPYLVLLPNTWDW